MNIIQQPKTSNHLNNSKSVESRAYIIHGSQKVLKRTNMFRIDGMLKYLVVRFPIQSQEKQTVERELSCICQSRFANSHHSHPYSKISITILVTLSVYESFQTKWGKYVYEMYDKSPLLHIPYTFYSRHVDESF